MNSPWLDFVITVDGTEVVRDRIDASAPPDLMELASRHARVCDDAEAEGKVWLMELVDPDQGGLPTFRASNDPSHPAIKQPVPLTSDSLEDWLARADPNRRD